MVSIHLTEVLSRIPTRPAYVKEAADLSEREKAEMPSRAFADKSRKFPCYNKSATWLSAVDHYSRGKKDERVEAGLRKAASYFGIEDDIKAVSEMFQPKGEKRASKAEDFACKVSEADGTSSYLFPISTEQELVKSAGSLESTRSRTTFDMRNEAAKNMLKRASDFGTTLPGYVWQAAGVRPQQATHVKRAMSLRAAAVRNDEHKERYLKLAAAIPDNDEPLFEPHKFASLIDVTDRIAGLHTKYGGNVETPEEICFRPPEAFRHLSVKVASRDIPVSVIQGRGLRLDDLEPLGNGFQAKVAGEFNLDKSCGIDFVKFACEVQDLSDSDQVTLGKILKRIGI